MEVVFDLLSSQYDGVFDVWLMSGGAPTWVWAVLLTVGFVVLSALTMALARLPAQRAPPPLGGADDAADEIAGRELDATAGAGLLDRGELDDSAGPSEPRDR